jgi:hypothetical protein
LRTKQKFILMKKLLYPVLLFVVAFMVSCEMGPTTEDAIDFNDEIVADFRKLSEADDAFIDAMYYDDIAEIENAMYDLQDFVKETTEEYEDMGSFDDEDIFRTAFLELLDVYNDIAFKDYPKLVDYIYQVVEEGNTEIGDEYVDFAGEIDDKAAEAKEDFYAEQEKFAEQYDFVLE